jgi:hypothetical protein
VYIDDGIFGAESFAEAVLMQAIVIGIYESLGFRLNRKTYLLPTQSPAFLGAVAHCAAATPTWHIPAPKMERYRESAQSLLSGALDVPVRKLAKTIGQLVSMAIAVPITKVLSSELYDALYHKPVRSWKSSSAHLSTEALSELRFFVEHVEALNAAGFPIWFSEAVADLEQLAPHFVLRVDSSKQGAGWQLCPAHRWRAPVPLRSAAFHMAQPPDVPFPPSDLPATEQSESRHVPYVPSESELSQAMRELLGVAHAVRDVATVPGVRGRRFRVVVDAMATVYIWRNGGGRSRPMCRILRFLIVQCLRAGIQLVDFAHCSGKHFESDGTDALSRPPAPANTTADRDSWRLTADTFAHILDWAGLVPDIDLFASRHDTQLPRYFAKDYDAGRTGTPDAFANDWGGLTAYAFPPQCLITSTIRHAQRCNCTLVIVVPYFPAAFWWLTVVDASSTYLHLPRSDSLVQRLIIRANSVAWEPVRRPFCELAVFLLRPRS